jgi:hypothetical protein
LIGARVRHKGKSGLLAGWRSTIAWPEIINTGSESRDYLLRIMPLKTSKGESSMILAQELPHQGNTLRVRPFIHLNVSSLKRLGVRGLKGRAGSKGFFYRISTKIPWKMLEQEGNEIGRRWDRRL